MKTETVGTRHTWDVKRRIWTLLVLLVALISSAVVGTQPVRASSACTSSQCSLARSWASIQGCSGHSGLAAFLCPIPQENDDFYFQCGDGFSGIQDCANVNNPS